MLRILIHSVAYAAGLSAGELNKLAAELQYLVQKFRVCKILGHYLRHGSASFLLMAAVYFNFELLSRVFVQL
jgi:hypothetical protein